MNKLWRAITARRFSAMDALLMMWFAGALSERHWSVVAVCFVLMIVSSALTVRSESIP